MRPCAAHGLSLPKPVLSSKVPTSVLSETEGHHSLRLWLSLVTRGGIALQQRPAPSVRGLHSPKILAPNLCRTDPPADAAVTSAPAWGMRRSPAHAASTLTLPAS